jgi:hypothetical protein
MLSDVANYFQIFGFPIAIAALIFAWFQIRSAARTSRVQMLLALDTRLADYEEIRRKINAKNRDIDDIDLRRYIAVFERVGLALRYRQISREEVHRFYGERFVKLIEYSKTANIVKNPEGWKDFYYLFRQLRDYDGYREKLRQTTINKIADERGVEDTTT